MSPVSERSSRISYAVKPGSHRPSPKNVFSGCCMIPVFGSTSQGAYVWYCRMVTVSSTTPGTTLSSITGA